MDCLKDLKDTQDKHSSEINKFSNLQSLIEKLNDDLNDVKSHNDKASHSPHNPS